MFSPRRSRSRSNAPRSFKARYPGICSHCRYSYAAGKWIVVDVQSDPDAREYMHMKCNIARLEGETPEETRRKIRMKHEMDQHSKPEGTIWEPPPRIEKDGKPWGPDDPFA